MMQLKVQVNQTLGSRTQQRLTPIFNTNIQILCNTKGMATVVKVGRQLMWQLWTVAHDGTQHSIIIYITQHNLALYKAGVTTAFVLDNY